MSVQLDMFAAEIATEPETADETDLCLGRYEHAWYVRRFLGGVDCGRCGLYVPDFCMVKGKPTVHTHAAEGEKP